MRTCYVSVTMLIILITAPSLSAQDLDGCPVKISRSAAVRNETVSITVANPPMVKEGLVQLVGPRSAPPVAVALNNGTMAYAVPGDLPLGQYVVTVKLGTFLFSACKTLRIVSALNREPKLSPFEPDTTYNTETVSLPDEKSQHRKLKTVQLALRGSGFIVDTPDDNQILVNGEAHPVKWGNGADLPDAANPAPNQIYGRVVSPEKIALYRVPVPADGILQIKVKQGDMVTDMQRFTVYRWSRLPVAMASGAIGIVLSLIVLMLVHFFIRTQPKEISYNVFKVLFLDPETATYSLSKLQFYFWTAAAIFGYSYLAISKMMVQGLTWPDIPGGLPGIIAIGAGTSVGAQVVTNLRGPKGAGSEHPNWGDFVTSGGVVAADRVQLLVWTLLGVGLFCVSALKYAPGTIRELDPVPDGILFMMGLSAAGYLGGKFARKQGPVITDITITPKASDEAMADADAPPPAGPPDLSQPVAEAQAIARSFGMAPSGAATAVNALTAAITAVVQAKTTSDAGTLITKLTELRAQAETAAKTAADAFAQAGAPSETARAAEIAQQAAAALQDMSAAVSSIVSRVLVPSKPDAAVPKFTRTIELRGRNLSSEALLEIDGEEIPYRMLVKKANSSGQPEVVIREPDDQTLARVLRLSIDPGKLEAQDFHLYRSWFGVSDDISRKTFTLINPDGQRSDAGFSVSSAAGPSGLKNGQNAAAPAPTAGKGV